ncbi:hypothetical protein BTR25_13790 [Bacillus sp. MRMR6]|nr:hypothetical protein BTR25_13790 [Bacillus sp. MRMR6]
MPTTRLLLLFLLVSPFLLIGTLLGDLSWFTIITVNLFILLTSLVDLWFSPKRGQLSFSRRLPEEMERDLSYQVEIDIKNNSQHSFYFRLIDDLPHSFQMEFPLSGIARKDRTTKISYQTSPSVRGKVEIEQLFFRYRSLLGLWEKQTTIDLPNSIKVIPDLTETKQFLENAQSFLLYEGVKIRKQRSGVGDFSKIRSYVVGDDPRKINWRQTAKLHEVMTNDYEPEHGKYITILIDCGRMMGAELTNGNRLEKVLEASMTVAAAALQKGDYVSVLAFSKEIKVYVPPAKGMGHLKTILENIYSLHVDAVESNYPAVLHYLEMVQKKRSLLLLFSDVKTFLFEESALAYLKRLRQRHLFFMIGIEDKTLIERINEEPVDVQAAMLKSIAQQQFLLKKREKMKWEKQGLQMIEAREEKLAAAAVSYYINMMNQNVL